MAHLLAKLANISGQAVPGNTAEYREYLYRPKEKGGKLAIKKPVPMSADLERILALPRRKPPDLNGAQGQALVEVMTDLLRRDRKPEEGPCKCSTLEGGRPCITTLKPAQAWALYEMKKYGPIMGSLAVGSGKTLLNIMAALVIPNVRTVVLLIPPSLRLQMRREYLAYREHFKVPSISCGTDWGWIVDGAPSVHVVPYSKLSRPESTKLLKQYDADLVLEDEGHSVSNMESATAKRFVRLFIDEPDKLNCNWTGSRTDDSLLDYTHLSAITLRDYSPVPLDPEQAAKWAAALDPVKDPAPFGELERLCAPGETVHQAFRRRVAETPGFVITTGASINASFYLHERKAPHIPPVIANMLRDLRASWTRPDGEELTDILMVAKSARELLQGFYYRWKFPHGEPEELILRWFAARSAYYKAVRTQSQKGEEHLDSEKNCRDAAIRFYEGYSGPLPVWQCEEWLEWSAIEDKVRPVSDTVWVDDFLAADAAKWAEDNKGIVWFDEVALGHRVAKLGGFAYHGGGPKAEAKILAEKGDRSIVVSMNAHGTGRDGLQYLYKTQLVVSPPSSGKAWEQLLGRLLREGQKAKEVNAYVYRHAPEFREAIDKAVRKARYANETMGSNQVLLNCNCDFELGGDY